MAHALHKRLHRAATREALTKGPTRVLFLLKAKGQSRMGAYRSDLSPYFQLQEATGFHLAFDKDRFEDFSSRVTVKVTPATVDGHAVTIATEPLIKDVQ